MLQPCVPSIVFAVALRVETAGRAGANTGIGKATALALAKGGGRIILGAHVHSFLMKVSRSLKLLVSISRNELSSEILVCGFVYHCLFTNIHIFTYHTQHADQNRKQKQLQRKSNKPLEIVMWKLLCWISQIALLCFHSRMR